VWRGGQLVGARFLTSRELTQDLDPADADPQRQQAG
jgi:hypothetical protein